MADEAPIVKSELELMADRISEIIQDKSPPQGFWCVLCGGTHLGHCGPQRAALTAFYRTSIIDSTPIDYGSAGKPFLRREADLYLPALASGMTEHEYHKVIARERLIGFMKAIKFMSKEAKKEETSA